MTRVASFFAFPLVALCLAAGTVPALAADSQAEVIKSISTQKSSVLVTIKFILKGEDDGMMGGDSEEEATGVMIDGSGLILVSSLAMGQNPFAAMMGRGSPTPTEIKVLVGDDTQGVEAKVIARDSELNMSWVRIDKAPEKPYTAVDLSSAGSASVGDELFAIDRMSKFFDRAVTVTPFRVTGSLTKPRTAMLNSGMQGGMGLPVFGSDGKVVGISTLMLPNKDEMEGMQGNANGMRDMMAGVIIPAKDVAEATKTALENAANAPAETKAEEKPAEVPGAAPAGDAKPE